MNKWLILFCAFIVFISACGDKTREIEELAAKCRKGDSEACKELADIAKNAKWLNDRVVAVEKLSDQKILADIAKYDEARTVRLSAIEKLTDQIILAYIAKNDKEEFVRQSAIQNPNLTDQKLLADIAENDKDGGVRGAALEKLSDQKILMYFVQDKENPDRWWAIKKLTDQTMLAKIALEDSFDGDIAFRKLRDQAQIEKTGEVNKDRLVRLIYKFISAFDSVPTEHRERLMKELFPAIRVFIYPSVVSAVGDIVSIRTEYTSTSRYYIGIGASGGQMKGELFGSTIKVQKLTEPLSCTWCTDFPSGASSLYFLPAEVNANDLVRELFEKITDQALLTDIAKNDKNTGIRIAATEKLVDHTVAQAIFADIARNNEYSKVREADIEKLTDQKLLANIAKSFVDYKVCEAAVKNPNLTDQALLADIAKNETTYIGVREAAVHKLTDLTMLTEIAKNGKVSEIRIYAADRLIDQTVAQAVFADIAKNNKDWEVREAAVRRLTSQALLADIARNDKEDSVRETAEKRLKELKGK